MKNKWVYAAALFFGLLTSYFVYDFLTEVEKTASEARTETVVVATCNIPAKTMITAEMLALKKVPQGSAHAQAIREVRQGVGTIATMPLLEGEQLLQSKVVSPKDFKNGLAYVIPPGKRAVSIPVDEISGVANLLQPGDRVDVLSVMSMTDAAGAESIYSLLVLQDIQILAVGKRLDPKGSDSNKQSNQQEKATVTLAVTVEEAQSLFLANQQGTIRLMLRSPVDDGVVEASPLKQADLL